MVFYEIILPSNDRRPTCDKGTFIYSIESKSVICYIYTKDRRCKRRTVAMADNVFVSSFPRDGGCFKEIVACSDMKNLFSSKIFVWKPEAFICDYCQLNFVSLRQFRCKYPLRVPSPTTSYTWTNQSNCKGIINMYTRNNWFHLTHSFLIYAKNLRFS